MMGYWRELCIDTEHLPFHGQHWAPTFWRALYIGPGLLAAYEQGPSWEDEGVDPAAGPRRVELRERAATTTLGDQRHRRTRLLLG